MAWSMVASACWRARRSSVSARYQVRSKAAIWRCTRVRSLAARGIGEEGSVEGWHRSFGEEGAVEVGLDALQVALLPVGAEHGIDVEDFGWGFGAEVAVVGGGESVVVGGIFAGDDDGGGVDAVFQGIEAGGGLALDGAGSGGLQRVGAIGINLGWGCHDYDLACRLREFWVGLS